MLNLNSKNNKPHSHAKKGFFDGLPLKRYIIYLLLAVVFSTTFSFAKYKTSTSGISNARVARFIVVAAQTTADEIIALDLTTNDTDSVEYVFTVSNYKDSIVCEVSVEYNLQIILPQALPNGVTLSMKCNEQSIALTTNDNITYIAERVGKFDASVKATDTCTLIFTADAVDVDYDFNLNGIQIKLDAVQII